MPCRYVALNVELFFEILIGVLICLQHNTLYEVYCTMKGVYEFNRTIKCYLMKGVALDIRI
jgi:hypothetical protein